MTAPSDPTVPKALTANKSMAAGAGGLAGGTLGLGVLLYLDYHNIKLTTEQAGMVTMLASTISGWLASFFMPIITAAQEAALRKLQDEK